MLDETPKGLLFVENLSLSCYKLTLGCRVAVILTNLQLPQSTPRSQNLLVGWEERGEVERWLRLCLLNFVFQGVDFGGMGHLEGPGMLKVFNISIYVFFFFLIFRNVLLFSDSVVSDPLWPCGLQDSRLPCLSLSPEACSSSCPSNWWCHPTTSSSVIPFSSRLQSFPASGSFPISQLFAPGGQRTGASALASVLLMNIQDWFPLQSRGDSRAFSNTTVQQHQFSAFSLFYGPGLTPMHDYWKNHSFD